jgi:hypothetical protein
MRLFPPLVSVPVKRVARLLALAGVGACSPSAQPSVPPHTEYRLALKPAYLRQAVGTYLRTARVPRDSAFVYLVVVETISHQYSYFSSASIRPRYELGQPEGWLIQDGVLVVVMQAGDFYRRNPRVEHEVDYQLDSLGVHLGSGSVGMIEEPGGQRLSYCLRSKSLVWDNWFYKVADDLCEKSPPH